MTEIHVDIDGIVFHFKKDYNAILLIIRHLKVKNLVAIEIKFQAFCLLNGD